MLDDNLSFVRPWGFDVSGVAVPTRIMAGRDDDTVPVAHGRWLADRIPGAEFVLAPGGHLGFERHDEEEALIAWLGGHDA